MTQTYRQSGPTTSTPVWANEPDDEQAFWDLHAASRGECWIPVLTPLVFIWTIAAMTIVPACQKYLGVPVALLICLVVGLVHTAAYFLGYGLLRIVTVPPTGAAIGGSLLLVVSWTLVFSLS